MLLTVITFSTYKGNYKPLLYPEYLKYFNFIPKPTNYSAIAFSLNCLRRYRIVRLLEDFETEFIEPAAQKRQTSSSRKAFKSIGTTGEDRK